jgi:hypothetical protein
VLSAVAEPEGDVIYIHADAAGVAMLEKVVAHLKKGLGDGDCPHDHLMSLSWGGNELTESMLAQERAKGCKQVHHVKVYGWTDEWASRHELDKH